MGYKFNPFTGTFDLTGSSSGTADGFLPYDYIAVDTSITVPQYRQMNIYGELVVLGELIVDGSVRVLNVN